MHLFDDVVEQLNEASYFRFEGFLGSSSEAGVLNYQLIALIKRFGTARMVFGFSLLGFGLTYAYDPQMIRKHTQSTIQVNGTIANRRRLLVFGNSSSVALRVWVKGRPRAGERERERESEEEERCAKTLITMFCGLGKCPE